MDGAMERLLGVKEKVPTSPEPAINRDEIEKKRHELTELGKPPLARKPGKYFRILAIDGGGVRGIIPSLIIKYIEERTGKKVPELFNMVAGTSTGALLGIVLCIPSIEKEKVGYTSKDTLGLYTTECPRIFKTSILQRMLNLGGLADAKYPSVVKRKVLNQYAGNLRISDCLTDVLVPSFDMREGVPYFFKSTMAREDPKYDYRIADMLDATSAAPMYFKPCKVMGQDADPKLGYRCFIDGAVTANCPALAAVLEAIKVYGEKPDNIVVVSLGCGDADIGRSYEQSSNMGALGWATYIPNALISGSIYNTEQQADQMLNDTSYWRFQTRVPQKNASIDDASPQNLLWLKRAGKDLVRREKKRLDELCDILMEGLI